MTPAPGAAQARGAVAPAGTLLVLALVVISAWTVRATNGGGGLVRFIVVAGLTAAMAALAFAPGSRPVQPAATRVPGRGLRAAVAVAACVIAVLSASSILHTARTGRIPMDEGQTSLRAGRALAEGANPYGADAIIDFAAYVNAAAPPGGSPGRRAAVQAALAAYDQSLSGSERARLLADAGPDRSRAIFGYKYGPLQLMLGRLAAALGSPAWIMVENGLGTCALLLVQWAVLRRVCGPDRRLALVALLALLLDANVIHAYAQRSATDVFSLTFGGLAVLAHLARRPYAAALAVAAAVAFKLLPGALFAPVLLFGRQPRAIALMVAAAAAAHLPWLAQDPAGLARNLLVWPFIHSAGASTWLAGAPALRMASLVVGAVGAAAFWVRALRSTEPALCATLAGAAGCVLIASGGCADNYLPWITLWGACAAAEAAGRLPRVAAD